MDNPRTEVSSRDNESSKELVGKGSNGAIQDDCMLGYFLSALAVRALQIRQTVADDPGRAALLAELQSSLATFSSRFKIGVAPTNHTAWTEVYRLERVLALAEPASSLVGELKRQTNEAVEERIAAAPRLLAAFEAALPFAVDTSEKRRRRFDRVANSFCVRC